MRRLLIVLGVFALLAVAGWFGYQQLWLPRQTANEAPAYTTVAVERGSINSTVSATGSIEPQREAELTFRTPGVVQDLYVETGQRVSAGDLLSELETTDLTLALAQAQAAVEVSEAQLAKLETPPSTNDLLAAQAAVEVAQTGVAGAEASLEAAQAAYRQVLAPISADQQLVNLAQVRQAEANVQTAQRGMIRSEICLMWAHCPNPLSLSGPPLL